MILPVVADEARQDPLVLVRRLPMDVRGQPRGCDVLVAVEPAVVEDVIAGPHEVDPAGIEVAADELRRVGGVLGVDEVMFLWRGQRAVVDVRCDEVAAEAGLVQDRDAAEVEADEPADHPDVRGKAGKADAVGLTEVLILQLGVVAVPLVDDGLMQRRAPHVIVELDAELLVMRDPDVHTHETG